MGIRHQSIIREMKADQAMQRPAAEVDTSPEAVRQNALDWVAMVERDAQPYMLNAKYWQPADVPDTEWTDPTPAELLELALQDWEERMQKAGSDIDIRQQYRWAKAYLAEHPE